MYLTSSTTVTDVVGIAHGAHDVDMENLGILVSYQIAGRPRFLQFGPADVQKAEECSDTLFQLICHRGVDPVVITNVLVSDVLAL
jgi:hypothetical protein